MVRVIKNNPGCACCLVGCPDCTGPIPASTGITTENNPWYLTTEDPNNDLASYHYVALHSAESQYITDETYYYSIVFPGEEQDYIRIRSYFAYKDSDNHAFVEVWCEITSLYPSLPAYKIFVDVYEVTDGVQTQIVDYEVAVCWFVRISITICYDKATGKAQITVLPSCSAMSSPYSYRIYHEVTLSQSPEKGVYYGYGFGEIRGYSVQTLSNLAWYNEYKRNVELCYACPSLYCNKGQQVDSATIEIDGVTNGNCSNTSVLNGTFQMDRPTHDKIGWASVSDLVTEEIDAGCIYVLFSFGLGRYENVPFNVEYRLKFNNGSITLYAWSTFYGFGYVPEIIATSTVNFPTECNRFDCYDALDGLVFDDWIQHTDDPDSDYGWEQLPDYTNAEATITL